MSSSNRKRLPYYPSSKDVKAGDQVYSLHSNIQDGGRGSCSVRRNTIYKVIEFDPHRSIALKIDCCDAGHYWFPENFEVVVEPAVVQTQVVIGSQFALSSQLSKLAFIAKTVGFLEAEKILRDLAKKEMSKRP